MYNYTRFFILLLLGIILSGFGLKDNVLKGKVICIDAGHGGTAQTDLYRQGPTGEREEWVNLRVAILLKALLEAEGAKVVMTRTSDDFVPLATRSKIARENKAQLFLSIHHNATADSTVNFPIVYFHGKSSENKAGVAFGKEIARAMQSEFYEVKTPVSVVSDHTVFALEGASVLRNTYGIPGVLSEASFFTNPKEERQLKDPEHNRREAVAYLKAIRFFFSNKVEIIKDKDPNFVIPPFQGLQEAERMSEVAKKWLDDYRKGSLLMKSKDTAALQEAYELFTRSARSFPDSYVARQCHEQRVYLLKKLGKKEEARQEKLRSAEFYVK
ncbi:MULTISPECIES: N-acetylmuramoyl-L-alanine amidase family protein [Pedobacter]|uniref:N-acetylmuramoyl-L-alanine amidase n=1 Tax=Pedobacter heparinus (strain ATCC 13125 / DSM 2366 / CIP 104194 / JCM 7457 / NBRC 12017 / NCIMB 9290 / NRRL B-14731 / HIM 762-3) TaxID=485917 RepID=C6XSB6_PEDHD|nr:MULTISPECIES: N-acetylmuramoyl-L-alanine amidase [Pedobacter]ACU03461.1 cell wall hydrolase/autolysin [Pedobacter heparinus DSM 2366]MBB5439060.1 N-acetylmuramoyl-L-alanine amidase [Pedobacter sp. AK017]